MTTLMGRAVALLLSAGLIACTTLDDVQDARKLEIKTGVASSNYGFYYDDVMGSYRERMKIGPAGAGALLKDDNGRLIRTEQELFGSVEPARKKNPDDQHSPVVVGTGVIYALGLVGAAIYFWPVTLGLPIVHGILAMPFSPVASHLKKDYQRDAERDYAEARRDFDAGEYEQALEEWEKARVLMPSIQTDSDINYWRGRAFESLHHRGEALIAYNRFLEDSTTTPPPYFQHQDDGDAKWKEKEADAVRRLNAIVAAGIGALPDLRSSVSTISLPP